MNKNEYEGFEIEGDKVKKGSKTIARIIGNSCIQEKYLPRHYLRKAHGFGISLGMLKRLKDANVSDFVLEIVKNSDNGKVSIQTLRTSISNLLKAQKIKYAGYDEQRLLKWDYTNVTNKGMTDKKEAKSNGGQ